MNDEYYELVDREGYVVRQFDDKADALFELGYRYEDRLTLVVRNGAGDVVDVVTGA